MSDKEIERIYLDHRSAFKAWAGRTFGLSGADAQDVYQEAIVAFVRNVRNGRHDPSSCAPGTYLFALGRNLALKHLRRDKDALTNGLQLVLPAPDPSSVEERMDEEHEQHLIQLGMAQLTDREREILRLYYFEERSMSEIAGIMGYNNADVAKKMKHVSFRKLATLIRKALAPRSTAHVE